MTDRDGIVDALRGILRRQLRDPAFEPREDMKVRDLAVDSLDLIETVFAIEDHFGVDLPMPQREAASDITPAADWTLAHLVDWIAARAAAKVAADGTAE